MKLSSISHAIFGALLVAAVAPCGAQGYLSPSAEFEQKMAPHRRQEFVLPSSADSATAGESRVIDIGRRPMLAVPPDETSDLIREQKRQSAEETRLNRTYSEPKYERPMPRQISCSQPPVVCVER